MVKTRRACNRLEIDLLPPFGEPEVYVMGTPAKLAAGLVGIGIGIGYIKKLST